MAGVARMIEAVAVGDHLRAQPGDDGGERHPVERNGLVEPLGDLLGRERSADRSIAGARAGEIVRGNRHEHRGRLGTAIVLEAL